MSTISRYIKPIVLHCIMLLVVVGECYGQSERYGVLFYNVENLFDTINSPASLDEDMLPLADKEWDVMRYRAKLEGIARVISRTAEGGDYPTLVGLAEVENRNVLEDLIRQESIIEVGYGVCHIDSPDERGIDVALLYRADKFELVRVMAIGVDTGRPTRDILLVEGRLAREPVAVVVAHLPSRIGGVKFTSPARQICCSTIRSVVDSLQQANPKVKVLIMGDMNDNPKDINISRVLGAKTRVRGLQRGDLYCATASLRGLWRGSSRYRGRWNMYDNFILTENLLSRSNSLRVARKRGGGCDVRILDYDFLLNGAGEPLATYRGNDYLGGVSDHLPITITLER